VTPRFLQKELSIDKKRGGQRVIFPQGNPDSPAPEKKKDKGTCDGEKKGTDCSASRVECLQRGRIRECGAEEKRSFFPKKRTGESTAKPKKGNRDRYGRNKRNTGSIKTSSIQKQGKWERKKKKRAITVFDQRTGFCQGRRSGAQNMKTHQKKRKLSGRKETRRRKNKGHPGCCEKGREKGVSPERHKRERRETLSRTNWKKRPSIEGRTVPAAKGQKKSSGHQHRSGRGRNRDRHLLTKQKRKDPDSRNRNIHLPSKNEGAPIGSRLRRRNQRRKKNGERRGEGDQTTVDRRKKRSFVGRRVGKVDHQCGNRKRERRSNLFKKRR